VAPSRKFFEAALITGPRVRWRGGVASYLDVQTIQRLSKSRKKRRTRRVMLNAYN
jgi:hypothetical protein